MKQMFSSMLHAIDTVKSKTFTASEPTNDYKMSKYLFTTCWSCLREYIHFFCELLVFLWCNSVDTHKSFEKNLRFFTLSEMWCFQKDKHMEFEIFMFVAEHFFSLIFYAWIGIWIQCINKLVDNGYYDNKELLRHRENNARKTYVVGIMWMKRVTWNSVQVHRNCFVSMKTEEKNLLRLILVACAVFVCNNINFCSRFRYHSLFRHCMCKKKSAFWLLMSIFVYLSSCICKPNPILYLIYIPIKFIVSVSESNKVSQSIKLHEMANKYLTPNSNMVF